MVCNPPCTNGVCVRNNTCSCSEGYTGETCAEAVVGECEENLCENGGTCTLIGTSYVCSCPDGYSGVLCQEPGMPHVLSATVPCMSKQLGKDLIHALLLSLPHTRTQVVRWLSLSLAFLSFFHSFFLSLFLSVWQEHTRTVVPYLRNWASLPRLPAFSAVSSYCYLVHFGSYFTSLWS